MDKWRICGNAEFNAIFLRLRWKLEDFDQMQARSQGGGGGQGGQLTPPLRTKGPLFGTSHVKLLRPITING